MTGTFPSTLVRCFCLQPQFLHINVMTHTLLNTSWSSLELSLYVVLSTRLFCKLQLHWSFPTFSSVSSIQSICWALPEFLLLAPCPGNVLEAVSCGNHKAYLICFLSLCPSLSDVYCLEKHCFIYFACIFVWFRCRVSLVSPTPSLLGTEMVHWNL